MTSDDATAVQLSTSSLEPRALTHIAVIVITYRRPSGLAKLLTALRDQRLEDGERDVRPTVLVVDNDKEESGREVALQFASSPLLDLRYIVEPRQGIPLARNRGISSVPADAEFLCFIDDDEWPPVTWISELLKTQRATGADCIHGAVIPVYPPGTPAWLIKSRLFESWRFSDQERLSAAASNNVLISTAFMRRTGHRFDERMLMTGGSDYLFFRRAIALGMYIAWSDKAPVYEAVPPSRITWRWILRRQYRLGNTFSLSERIAGTPWTVMSCAIKGIARMSLGAIMLPTIPFSPHYGMRSIVHLVRGAGTFVGALGHTMNEYSPQGLAKDRVD